MTPLDFNGLDTTVHGPVRLGVLTALFTDGELDFTTLKKRLQVPDGALGLHLKRLEEVGYIASHKAFVGRRPRTTYSIKAAGNKAFIHYIKTMRELVETIERKQA